MSRSLTVDEVYEAILPLKLDPGDEPTSDEIAKLFDHCEELSFCVTEMEADAFYTAGRSLTAKWAARDLFHHRLLAVAGRLMLRDEIYFKGVGLRIAALIAERGDKDIAVARIFDVYDEQTVDAWGMAIRTLSQAKFMPAAPAPDQPPPAPSECIDPAQESALDLYEELVSDLAGNAIKAGAVMTPDTKLGDRIHENAVVAMIEASQIDIWYFKRFILEYGQMCLDADKYPGAAEIFIHAYEALQGNIDTYIDAHIDEPFDTRLVHLVVDMLNVDAACLGYLHAVPRLRVAATMALEKHVQHLSKLYPTELPNTLYQIRKEYNVIDIGMNPSVLLQRLDASQASFDGGGAPLLPAKSGRPQGPEYGPAAMQ
jgi:biotin carboxyl carrier protein